MKLSRLGTVLGSLILSVSLAVGCSGKAIDQVKASSKVEGTPIALETDTLEKTSTYVSDKLVVDDIFKSMMGPGRQDYLSIDPENSELAWLTGYSVEIVGPDGESEMSPSYLCHSNLTIADRRQHYMSVNNLSFNPGRYFTISQGQSQAQLPEGFGIPINTKHPFNWNGQALNLNGVPETPITTRQKVELKYVLDRELKEPIQPLFSMSLVGLKTIGDKPQHYSIHSDFPELEGGGCLVGSSAVKDGIFTDAAGNQFTAHWIVSPGVEKNTTRLDDIFTIPYDTEIHYAMLHVHAFCESVELYDLTDDKTILSFDVEQLPDRIGLMKTDTFSSKEGVKVYKDHKYELRSVYNNTSGEDQDAMVVLYIYAKDKKFQKPDPNKVSKL